MKKMLLVGMVCALGIFTMACGNNTNNAKDETTVAEVAEKEVDESKDEGVEENTNDNSEKTIGLFMTHMSNEFTMTLSSSVEKEVKARGFNYKVYDAKQDAANQQNQIEQAVASGVNGIIIEPVSVDGIVPAVKYAKEENVPVVIVNQRISDPEAADCYVGADAVKTGATLMKIATEDINGKGNIALLYGPMGSDAQVGRSEGFEEVLKDYPDITVVYDDTAEWQTEKALSTTENWLSAGKEIVAIVSQNDGMAIGAAKAVADAGLKGKVFIYGIDATKDGLDAVIKGDMKATVGQGTAEQGKLSADACADLLEGKEVAPETIVDNEVFTIDNAQQALDAMN